MGSRGLWKKERDYENSWPCGIRKEVDNFFLNIGYVSPTRKACDNEQNKEHTQTTGNGGGNETNCQSKSNHSKTDKEKSSL